MGMDKAKSAFWMQMYEAKKIDKQAFSLCFSRSPHAAREGTSAGAMSMGGTDTRLHTSPMVYTEADKGSGFYRVTVRKAYLRAGPSGQSAANPTGAKIVPLDADESVLNTGHVIVDSGTTDTYFHRNFGRVFREAYQSVAGQSYHNKDIKMTKEQVAQYPTILFQLRGDVQRNQQIRQAAGKPVPGLSEEVDAENPFDVLLAIPPEHYFEYDEDTEKYTARFYVDESRGSVLGANSMMGHDVLFDVDSGVLGWAESDCDYPELVKKYFSGTIKDLPETGDEQKPGNGEDLEPTDEERFKPEDPEEVKKAQENPIEFCTGMQCQIFFAVALVSSIVLVGLRLARKSTEGVEEVEPAELEMQTPPSAMSSYRDDDDEEDGSGHPELT